MSETCFRFDLPLRTVCVDEIINSCVLARYVPDSQGPSAHVLDTATPEKADVAIESLHQVQFICAHDSPNGSTSLDTVNHELSTHCAR